MKTTRKTRPGERRVKLLKEYFLAASWIALLKRVCQEAAMAVPERALVPIPIRVRR
jgi:hypothetical protein